MKSSKIFNKSAVGLLSLAPLAIAVCMGVSGSAQADGWPTNISGSWSILANQSSSKLVVTQDTSDPQALCQSISGTVFKDTFQGFYCPGSGRIAFKRVTSEQSYSGNLSQTGTILYMAGTFDSLGGSFGEYNFSASMKASTAGADDSE